MAMRVSKTAITRLSIDMSCGCRMYAEFEDAQCKRPIGASSAEDEGTPPVERVFKVCGLHEKDAALSMLQFIIGERLDEAIVEAQKTPIHLHHLPNSRSEQEEEMGGVVGDSVQTVARVNRPAAVTRQRPDKPPGIKTIQRSPEQLAKAGAALRHAGGGSVEMSIDEASEDLKATPHIAELLDILDEREAGLFED